MSRRLILTLFLLFHLTFVFTQSTNATSSTSIPTTNMTTTPTPTVKPNNITTTNATTSNTTNTTTEAPTSTPTQITNVTTTATPTTAAPMNASNTTVPPATTAPTTVTPTTATPTTPALVTTSAPTNAATTTTPTTATPATSAPTVVSSSSSSTGIGGGIIPNPTTSPTLANKASTSSQSFTDLYIIRYQTYYYIAAGIIGGIILAIICALYIKRRIRIQRVMKSSQHHVRGTCDLPGVDLDIDLETGDKSQEMTASPLSSLDRDGHHRAQTESMAVSSSTISYGEIEGNISGIRKRQSEAEEARIERRRTRQESIQPIEETREEVMPHRVSESQEEREARIESRRATPLPSYV